MLSTGFLRDIVTNPLFRPPPPEISKLMTKKVLMLYLMVISASDQFDMGNRNILVVIPFSLFHHSVLV